jgi:NADH-quinone oxidoreductase subunit J
MSVPVFFFYLFSAIMIASAFMVISARNPVHSVLFLILAFVNAAGLFLMLDAEFLAMILIVVYVGAVAVLFLFVIMMLDVDFAELKQGFLQYLPIGIVVGACVFFELLSVVASWVIGSSSLTNLPTKVTPGVSNTLALGRVIYTQYAYLFEASGLILLTAMIGAIVLTLRHKQGVKRQVISEQNARNAINAIEVRKVASRQGI